MTDIFIVSVISAVWAVFNQTLVRRKDWRGWVGILLNVIPFTYVNIKTGAYGHCITSVFSVYNGVKGIWQWKIQPVRQAEDDPLLYVMPVEG